jgi:hypothetical protein
MKPRPEHTVMAIVLLAAAIILPLYWVAKGMGVPLP